MVINYKKLNDNTVFDGYYIPKKIIIFNRIQRISWFSKIDCKSGYWQIKKLLDKGLIRNSMSPHTSPAFMVRNYAEEKREKARMVINYKSLMIIMSLMVITFPAK